MPRFVILEHEREGDETHWDLMLEVGDILKTFRLDTPPEDVRNKSTKATPIFDHDRRFLTYEGPVHQGKGRVRRVDTGSFETSAEDDDGWRLVLKGKTLTGPHALRRSTLDREAWAFTPC